MVAGYEIVGVLGEGGMGIVFKARQVRLDRFVALKMIRAGAGAAPRTSPGSRPRPRPSRRSSTRISSRSSISANTPTCRICSLEYLSGGSLARLIGGKPQPSPMPRKSSRPSPVRWRSPTRRGIVHRDLKPANVLIAADGTLEDHRLRPGETARGRLEPDPHRLDPGNAELHVPRAGQGRDAARSGRPPTSTPWAPSSTSS